jgi:hypothetical protein
MNLDEGKILQINRLIHNDPVAFSHIMLGIDLHAGQRLWITKSHKTINILRPGNRWGKTMAASIKHIWQCMCKPNLDGKVLSYDEWRRVEYQTLNFGPTYELGRGALQLARDIVQGQILMPDGRTNKSLLMDWAIKKDNADSQVLPSLEFITGAKMLGRSFSEMGVAFKMKALAYISGDECADINELWTFTNNTLLPRMISLSGSIDLVGTPQPEGTDYMRMIEMAEEDMKRPDWEKDGLFYTQRGTMYENEFLPKDAIDRMKRTMDPMMVQQVINGDYVEIGDKYFGFERIQNAVKELVLLDVGLPDRKYVTTVDFAGGESAWADYTVIMTIDYTEEPYRVVQFRRFKGGDIPIPMQYALVREITKAFNGKLIIDSSSLGGKNAAAFLGDLQPISAEFGPTKSSTLKMDMLATLKITFDGGQSKDRKRERVYENGEWMDKVDVWGLIELPNIPVLISELQNYKLDDTKLRQDCVMCLAMGIHWIEMRRPKQIRRKAVDIDFYQ